MPRAKNKVSADALSMRRMAPLDIAGKPMYDGLPRDQQDGSWFYEGPDGLDVLQRKDGVITHALIPWDMVSAAVDRYRSFTSAAARRANSK